VQPVPELQLVLLVLVPELQLGRCLRHQLRQALRQLEQPHLLAPRFQVVRRQLVLGSQYQLCQLKLPAMAHP
jgi:hypothetical protein